MQPPSVPIPTLKTSGPGIVSCLFAAVTVVLAIIAAAVIIIARVNPTHGQPTTGDWMLGLTMLGSICGGGVLGLAGLITGIVGVALPNRKKTIAVIGLASNGALLGIVVFTMMLSA